MVDEFFKDFQFLAGFFQRTEDEQNDIEKVLMPHIGEEERNLATFLEDEDKISLCLLWIGKEFYRRTRK